MSYRNVTPNLISDKLNNKYTLCNTKFDFPKDVLSEIKLGKITLIRLNR